MKIDETAKTDIRSAVNYIKNSGRCERPAPSETN